MTDNQELATSVLRYVNQNTDVIPSAVCTEVALMYGKGEFDTLLEYARDNGLVNPDNLLLG